MTARRPLAPEMVTLKCTDSVELIGHYFASQESSRRSPVLICPATGVRQQFYWRFSDWLSANGHDVLVFDYRGIGLSRHGPLNASRATLSEWAVLDQPTALQWLLQRSGAEKAVLLGHSAGGQMIGLWPNHTQVERVVGMASSTGWFSGMQPIFALKARFALRLAIPVAAWFKGYAPTSWLGLGEDLPAGVARQWGQWCSAGGYATNAVRNSNAVDFHREIKCPITVLHASDDEIANHVTVRDLLRTFPAAVCSAFEIQPSKYSLSEIGHLNWFRESHLALWPLILEAMRGEPLSL